MIFSYGETELSYLKKKDAKMAAVIEQVGMVQRQADPDLFSSVIHHIIGQQISTKAQATIWRRMQDALGTVDAAHILDAGVDTLQALGMTFPEGRNISQISQGRSRRGHLIWRP